MNTRYITGRSTPRQCTRHGPIEYLPCDRDANCARYHDENTKLEDLTHPEDIEHFKKHEAMELEEERQEKLDKMAIVEDNIPLKFRRSS